MVAAQVGQAAKGAARGSVPTGSTNDGEGS